MANPAYSTLFSCRYDQAEPVGSIGRDAHHSIFRCVEWLDVTLAPLKIPVIHDFAVIWDEDHDERIIKVIEAIYMNSALAPVIFIGERKGSLQVIVDAKLMHSDPNKDIDEYRAKIQRIVDKALGDNDYWSVNIGTYDRDPSCHNQLDTQGIIQDTPARVVPYLKSIDALWDLGAKSFKAAVS